MIITLKDEIPPIDKLWPLFLSTGWNAEYALTPQELSGAVSRSWYVVSAYEDGRLVGFGRVVSDEILHAMVYDLIVDPDFRERGIGSQVLERLVTKCREANIRDIQLFSARGKAGFYEKRGFVPRPQDAPGMEWRGVYNGQQQTTHEQ